MASEVMQNWSGAFAQHWKPIEDAPDDGTPILAAQFVDSVDRVRLVDVYVCARTPLYSGWMAPATEHLGPRSVKPTHWVPMPGFPKDGV